MPRHSNPDDANSTNLSSNCAQRSYIAVSCVHAIIHSQTAMTALSLYNTIAQKRSILAIYKHALVASRLIFRVAFAGGRAAYISTPEERETRELALFRGPR